jgi:hypothetical protein
MNRSSFIGLSAVVVVCAAALAQAPARTQVAGTVTAVKAEANQISIKSDKGEAVTISLNERTPIVRIPAGETDVRKGTKIPIASVAEGDRIVAIGQPPAESKEMEARSVLVMSKADVAQIHQKDREDWQKRGITGTVTAIDPAATTLTVKAGLKTITVTPSERTIYHRYSADSARFADARPSSFAEIKDGDQLRVLGDRNEDGSAIKAEKIVSGSFRQLAATVTSVSAGTGEIQVKDLATKKPLAIRINADTTMRKLPDMMARALARRYQPGGGEGEGRGGPAGRGPAGSGDVAQMLDRLPALPFSELKPGDAIMVSTTAGSDPSRVTAITLLAGVEPLLTASPTATRDIMSGWNLGSGGDSESQ